jgi:hypothetical protein
MTTPEGTLGRMGVQSVTEFGLVENFAPAAVNRRTACKR